MILTLCTSLPQESVSAGDPLICRTVSIRFTTHTLLSFMMFNFTLPPQTDHYFQRDRSPRRRSRSPRRSRRSYSPRSRSRSRDDYRRSDRRSRSPMTGAGASGGYSGSGYGGSRGGAAPPPARSFEERAAAKEQMMQSVRESSQQDRRVYVGNLSYDVKWHHLKDFMRQG